MGLDLVRPNLEVLNSHKALPEIDFIVVCSWVHTGKERNHAQKGAMLQNRNLISKRVHTEN
jgi:hypothetical protein